MSERENGGRSDEDATVALMVAGLGGLVVGGLIWGAYATAIMHNHHVQRQAFHQDLAAALRQYGVDLISVALGRDRDNHFIWHVTVQDSNGVSSYPIRFDSDVDPYARTTLARLAASTMELLVEDSVSRGIHP